MYRTQVFRVMVDDGRSRKFPLAVPLHALRFVLGTADVETLAERVAAMLQVIMAVPVGGGGGWDGGGGRPRLWLRGQGRHCGQHAPRLRVSSTQAPARSLVVLRHAVGL